MKDESKVKYACPYIDEGIDLINRVTDDDISVLEIDTAIKALEEVRTIAVSLREWGNDQHADAETLEKEVERLEKELKDNEYRIQQLEEELNNLTSQVQELQKEY